MAVNVAYLGIPGGALALRAAGVPLAYCAVPYPSTPDAPPGLRRLRRLLGASESPPPLVVAPDLADDQHFQAFAAQEPDALLVGYWPRLIPPRYLRACRLGAYGVHPSLLPRHRGADPIFWTIRLGDPVTGVSLFALNEAFDEGPVLQARSLQVSPTDTAWTLSRRLDRVAIQVLVGAGQALAAGGGPERAAVHPLSCEEERRVLDFLVPSEAPQPREEELRIDIQDTVLTVQRKVRAACPQPGAWLATAEGPWRVREARPAREALAGLRPGDAYRVDDGLVLQVADGAVLLTRLLRDGA